MKEELGVASNGEASKRTCPEKTSQIMRLLNNFFNDSNYKRLMLTLGISQENGWVPVEAMLKFQSLAVIESGGEKIINIVRKQQQPGTVEAHESKLQIRRNPAADLPQHRKDTNKQTVFVSGFQKDTSFDNILQFFDIFEGVTNVKINHCYRKETGCFSFDGSAFVSFTVKSCLKKFMDLERLEVDDVELERQWLGSRSSPKQKLARGASMMFQGFTGDNRNVDSILAALESQSGKDIRQKLANVCFSTVRRESIFRDEFPAVNEQFAACSSSICRVLVAFLMCTQSQTRVPATRLMHTPTHAQALPLTAYCSLETRFRFKKGRFALKLVKDYLPEGRLEVLGSWVTVRVPVGEEEEALLKDEAALLKYERESKVQTDAD